MTETKLHAAMRRAFSSTHDSNRVDHQLAVEQLELHRVLAWAQPAQSEGLVEVARGLGPGRRFRDLAVYGHFERGAPVVGAQNIEPAATKFVFQRGARALARRERALVLIHALANL